MIGWLGTIALASHQVMLAISQFTFMMYYGMGAAVAVRVSNFKGQNDIINVRRSAYAGFHLMMTLGVVLSLIVFLRSSNQKEMPSRHLLLPIPSQSRKNNLQEEK